MRNRFQGWSRRKRWTVGIGALAVLTLTGAALAALLLRVPFNGGGDVIDQPVLAVGTVTVLDSDLTTCTATETPSDEVTVNLATAVRGGAFCDVRVTVGKATTDSVPLRVQDFDFAGVTDDTILAGCGASITSSSATPIDLRISVPATAPTGTFTADVDASITVVHGPDFDPAACPSP